MCRKPLSPGLEQKFPNEKIVVGTQRPRSNLHTVDDFTDLVFRQMGGRTSVSALKKSSCFRG